MLKVLQLLLDLGYYSILVVHLQLVLSNNPRVAASLLSNSLLGFSLPFLDESSHRLDPLHHAFLAGN